VRAGCGLAVQCPSAEGASVGAGRGVDAGGLGGMGGVQVCGSCGGWGGFGVRVVGAGRVREGGPRRQKAGLR
jgi:hypothetical protein